MMKQTVDHEFVDEYFTLSVVGKVIYSVGFGQYRERLRDIDYPYVNNEAIVYLDDIWKKYHLNDMKAACSHQTPFPRTSTTAIGGGSSKSKRTSARRVQVRLKMALGGHPRRRGVEDQGLYRNPEQREAPTRIEVPAAEGIAVMNRMKNRDGVIYESANGRWLITRESATLQE